MFNYQSPWHLSYQHSKNVLLNVKELKEKCYLETDDMIEKKRDNFKFNVDHDTILHNCETVKAGSTILKNNSKLNKKILSQLSETDQNENHVQISFISENSSEGNKYSKKKIKHKHLSCKKKEGFRFTDVWHEFSGWNIDFSVDNKKKISNKSLLTSVKLKTRTKQKKLTRRAKQQDIKHEVSHLRPNQNDEDLYNVPTNFTSEYICLQEPDSMDLQDSIDFSSNEIFSKFNYDFYEGTSLTGFSQYMNYSNETHNSLATTNESDTFEKEYDLNGNETDTSGTGCRFSTSEPSVFSEHLDKDILLLDNKKLQWTCDSCSDHCLGNYTSSWITANETRNDVPQRDKMLTATLDPNIIHMDSEIDLDSSDIYDIYLATDTSPNENSTTRSSSINYTDTIDLSLTELSNFCDEYKNIIKEILKETINSDQTKKFNMLNDPDDILFETDFGTSTFASGKEITDEYFIDTLQSKKDNEYSKNNKIFQCSICSLTFSNARTFAMHRAGAHEGMYVILCESCGTFFNRKYHFNRHFIHCSRLKTPFRCGMCMKAYRHKSSLVHHLKESHCVRNERSANFICGVCNKMYRRFGAFENHLRKYQHTPGKLLTYCEDL